MAMQQNVVAALRGGPVALIAAVGSVVLCGLFVSFINRMEPETEAREESK
jgi:malonate transporter MadL subunit